MHFPRSRVIPVGVQCSMCTRGMRIDRSGTRTRTRVGLKIKGLSRSSVYIGFIYKKRRLVFSPLNISKNSIFFFLFFLPSFQRKFNFFFRIFFAFLLVTSRVSVTLSSFSLKSIDGANKVKVTSTQKRTSPATTFLFSLSQSQK